jgi:uncharacterized protein with beta-barrel porin domain
VGKLLMVVFCLLAYGQASATCNISFTAAAGGTVTFEAANSQFAGQPARYKFLFSPSDNTACGDANLFGINDVNGIATAMNDEGVVTNTSKYISSTKGSGNVIIHSVNNSGSNDFSGFYYTIPTGLSNTTDTFFFVDGSATGTSTVTVTIPAQTSAPGAPTIGTATAGNTTASVAFTAPASDGGSAITGYTVTSSPGNITGTGTSSPISVTGLTNGTSYTFTVTATNAIGTGTASAASNAVTPKAPQTITFTNPGAKNFGTTPTLTATASSGLTPTFTSTTTGICTITSGGALTFVATGNCTINADQAGTAAFQAATTVSQTFAVNAVVPDAPSSPIGTAGNGQVSVAFIAPVSNGGSSISGYTVTASPGGFTGSGAASPIIVAGLANGTAYTFTVTATNSAGTSSASSASAAVTPKSAQTITFTNPGAKNFGTSPTITATASSGLTPTFTSVTTGICTITSGGVLTFVTAGNCTINADQAGNAVYQAATTVGQTFAVNAVVPGAPTSPVGTAGSGQVSVAFTAPVSNGGSSITGYTVTSSPGGFTGSGSASPIIVAGLANGTAYTFTVTATNSAGTGSASSASAAVTPKSAQAITFNNPGAQTYGTSPTLVAMASSGLVPTFTSVTPGVCTVTSAGVLTFVSSGTCSINADQSGNVTYLAATTVTQTFSVSEAVGVLTFATPSAASVTMGSSLTNVATSTLVGGSYGAISYSSSNTAVATVSASGVVTPVSAGTSTITATQAAVVGVNAQATQSYLLTVGKNAQAALTVTSDKTGVTKVTGTATLTTAGGSGTGAISYAVTTGSCSVTGSVLSAGSIAETCVVTATKAADASYSAATATVSVQVLNQAVSTVTLASSSLNPMVGQSVNLTATLTPSTATGTASFKDGATVIGSASISGGVASVVTSALAIGSHNLTVVYSGDAGTAGSVSGVVVVSVNVRPDPSSNHVVVQNVTYQAATAQRFTVAQMSNIYNHVQILHSDFSIRNRFGASFTAPNLDTLRVAGAKILDDLGGAQDRNVLPAEEQKLKTTEYQRLQKVSFAQGGAALQNEQNPVEDEEADHEPVTNSALPRIADMPTAFWTAGNIEVGSVDGLDGFLTKFSSRGLTFGMDVKVSPKLIVGASVGYARDNATFDDVGSESKAQQWSGSLYLSYKPEKHWFVDGALGVGDVAYDNRRWDSTNKVLLSGDRKGKVVYGSLSLTREMTLQKVRVSPFGRADVVNVKLDSYSEQGSALALTYNDSRFTNTSFTGGLDISRDYVFAGGQLTPSFKLQFSSSASSDVVQSMYYTDSGSGGSIYNAIVTGMPNDMQSLGLGLSFRNRRGLQANVAWLGTMGANAYRANSLRMTLRYGF